MADLKVGVACTVVPDGGEVNSSPASIKLRISVMLAPLLITAKDPMAPLSIAATNQGGIPLPSWPEEIMRVMQSGEGGLRIHLKSSDGDEWTSVDLVDPDAKRPGYEKGIADAQGTWQRSFGGGATADFQAVLKVLAQDSTNRAENFGIRMNLAQAKEKSQEGVRSRPVFKHMNAWVSPSEVDAPNTQLLADSLLWMHATDLLRSKVPFGKSEYEDPSLVREKSWQFADQFRSPLQSGSGLDDAASFVLDNAASNQREVNVGALDEDALRTRLDQVEWIRRRDQARQLPFITRALASFDKLATDRKERPDGIFAASIVLQAHTQATRFERPHDMEVSNPLDDEQLNVARRRLAGIRSNPTIAKQVQMTVDVELTVSSAEMNIMGLGKGAGDWFGDICAEFVPKFKDHPKPDRKMGPAGLMVTKTRANVVGGYFHFGPASRYEYNQRRTRSAGSRALDSYQANLDIPLEHGFLNMLVQPGRFRIRTFDATLGVTATGEALTKKEQKTQEGAAAQDISDRLPALYTHGMELIDVQSGPAAEQDLARSFMLAGEAATCFAEDLLSGFRVDVEMTRASGTDWCPATARKLTYEGIKPKGKDAHLFPAFAHRDEGLVQALIRELKVPDAKLVSRGVFFTRQELFTWTGAPLSLPVPPSEEPDKPEVHRGNLYKVADLDASRDLNIGVTYDFASDELPSLRLGYGYRFVLRACYGNGGGPRFEPEKLETKYDQVALGQSGTPVGAVLRKESMAGPTDLPTPFAVHDPLGAPELTLPADDKLVTSADLESLPNEKIDRVTLRWDGNPAHDGVRRILLPPRVAFTTAELQGQFDTSQDNQPRGALRYVKLGDDTGALPQAIAGRIEEAKQLTNGKAADTAGEHRGAVFVPNRGRTDVKLPWYCDKRARRVIVALSRGGVSGGDLAPPCQDLVFWKETEHPDKALPIVLEFRMAKAGATGARFVGKPVEREFNIGGRFKAMHLVVEVGLAETIVVKAWCLDDKAYQHSALIRTLVDAAKFSSKLSVQPLAEAEQLARLDSKGGVDKSAEMLRFFGDSHDSGLADSIQWSVTAAIRRPWHAPSFRVDKTPEVEPLSFTRLKSTGALKTWDNVMATPGQNPSTFQESEGSVAFVRGTVAAHRRSTESLRFQLVWRDFDDSVCVKKDDKGVWTHQPQTRTEIQIMPVALDEKIASTSVNVAAESWQMGQPLRFDVGTRAVRVGLRVVAKSRFENCFQRPAAQAQVDPSRYESESIPYGELLPQTDVESDRSMWIPATVRPPVPELSGLELVYHRREVARSRAQVIVESQWKVRVKLKPRTWYASGEGELLAVVLSPSDLVDNASAQPSAKHVLSEAENKKSPDHRRMNLLEELPFISRLRAVGSKEDAKLKQRMKLLALVSGWGADPASQAGKLDAVMSAGHFAGWSVKHDALPLPFKLEDPLGNIDGIEAMVSVIAYQPLLDSATGERHVDIDLLMPEVDAPFVRLSLARYQPHAMRKGTLATKGKDKEKPSLIDLSLSPQVLRDVGPVPSVRRATVSVSDGKISVKVTGAAHQRRSPGLPLVMDTEDGNKYLEENRYKTDVPLMRIKLMRLGGRGPTQTGEEKEVPALINGNHGIWETEFAIDEHGDFQVFIQECVWGVSSVTPGSAQKVPTLVEAPRGFQCDIPLSV